MKEDISFPAGFLPALYQSHWWGYLKFFLEPKGSVTPLHFDCLLTHNFFFQVYGRKKFILMPYDNEKLCGRFKWRWFRLNPEDCDPAIFQDFEIKPVEIIVEPGDILYMPPGTLHYVRSLDTSISFNIDFHTPSSSLRGLAALFQGMPWQNVYYNFACALGLVFQLPERVTFRLFKSYLNYVS